MNVEIKLPPGVFHNGTERQARGRWWLSHLVRWQEGALRPWLGWELFATTSLTGAPRAMTTWKDNSNLKWCAVGTNSNLYAISRVGTVSDITPSGFTAGGADAVSGGGYGSGVYGDGSYGAAGADPGLITDAMVWSLEPFGENLITCAGSDDGLIYKWDLDVMAPAAVIATAPIDNVGIVVTGEGVIFALGGVDLVAGGAANPRLVQWCDIRDETNWTIGLPSVAGSFPLQTAGRLMCGKRVKGATLLFTDVDVHRAEFQDPSNPYSFTRVGTDCGVISQGAACAVSDVLCVWMGKDGFFQFDGTVSPIPCDVSDYVFTDINRVQVSKVTCVNDPAAGEVRWFYPSATSAENNRYVAWNYRTSPTHWTLGEIERTCGAPKGVFSNPLMADSSGAVWSHEVGFDYTGAVAPFVECGPLEIGAADRTFSCLDLIPDEITVGSVEATFYAKLLPTEPEETFGPYTASSRTNLRFSAREVRMRLTSTGGDFRVGAPLIDVRQGGMR